MKNQITESQLIDLFEFKFSNKLEDKLNSLREEYYEFGEALIDFDDAEAIDKELALEHVKDELADLYSVVLDLLHLYDLDHQKAMNMVWDKIKTREKNPNYRKQWL